MRKGVCCLLCKVPFRVQSVTLHTIYFIGCAVVIYLPIAFIFNKKNIHSKKTCENNEHPIHIPRTIDSANQRDCTVYQSSCFIFKSKSICKKGYQLEK